jgi:hypothetical protein
MRDAVQLAVAAVEVAVEVVDVADIARARGTNRAIEAQKGAVFIMVASVGKEMNVSKMCEVYDENRAVTSTNGPAYL